MRGSGSFDPHRRIPEFFQTKTLNGVSFAFCDSDLHWKGLFTTKSLRNSSQIPF